MAKSSSNGNGAVVAAELGNVSNDAKSQVEYQEPYIVKATIEGTAALLFHRWSVEGVEEKSKAAKGSKAKKTDDIESYLYRDADRNICLPGEYLRMAVIGAAKFRQDPRSPRKSAMDLFKAGVISIDELCPLQTANGKKFTEQEYIDRRRVTVQRAGITRNRPAFHAGWRATATLLVNLPEYINFSMLLEVMNNAGRLIGLGDFRPTYGRFVVVESKVTGEES